MKAGEAKAAGRYTEHGIVMNPAENVHHGAKDAPPAPPPTVGYVPTLLDDAREQAGKAMEAGRYTEHGIVMDPAENVHHGAKDAPPAAPSAVGYVPTYLDEAREQAGKAMEAGRYTEHGILMNPEDNIQHGHKE
jgi:vacuolar-type H+-ATPase subunit B/Vma2